MSYKERNQCFDCAATFECDRHAEVTAALEAKDARIRELEDGIREAVQVYDARPHDEHAMVQEAIDLVMDLLPDYRQENDR